MKQLTKAMVLDCAHPRLFIEGKSPHRLADDPDDRIQQVDVELHRNVG